MSKRNRNGQSTLRSLKRAEQYNRYRDLKTIRSRKWMAGGLAAFLVFGFLTRNAAFWHTLLPLLGVFFACGAILTFLALWSIYQQHRSQRWPETRCLILVNDIERASSKSGVSFHPVVYYEYEVDDVLYSSDRIRFGLLGYSTSSKAEWRVKKYVEETEARCYYDPRNPAIAILERRISYKLPLILLLVAALFITVALLP